jgi:Sulfotransferase family
MNESARPLIIGGHPRSGTTLLARLCNSHPQMKVTFEFRNFREINVAYDTYFPALRKDWIRRRIVEKPGQSTRAAKFHSAIFLAEYLIRLQFFRKRLIDVDVVSQLLKRIFPQALVVGDKFPEYIFHLDSLASQKNLSIAIIYRDCRDVVSSTLRRVRTAWKNEDFAKNIDSAMKIAGSWLRAIECMEKYFHNIHVIRYEDLINDPKPVLKEFADWLRIDENAFQMEMIRTDRIGKYQSSLTEQELRDVLSVAGRTMERLGYKI